ncbi:TPA_asm: ROK family glucokinase [Listeria innocua]|uniref:ROK family glucokinase n=1 Tax=Listeria innocua TaxID=1642 RepID=UPI000FA8AC37|nr:ROK family glucokinase [Listeria innocua]QPQ96089.1 ROK family glucokinase [Listeria welshimeri]EAD5842125.1 ROK family glucokinase [Listeria innocua]EAG8541466.1 ROK family glucokinase [Listeria innocua]ECL7896293.1 ROK family glucokinase [Listeria innocua]ECL8006207.1 ROK family glucokinase [Listeria innocua]
MNKKLIGVDLGGTTAKLAILTKEGDIEEKWTIDTNIEDKGAHIVKDIGDSINQKLTDLQLDNDIFYGIGMGTPGTVNYETGTVKGAYNLGWAEEQNISEDLEKITGLKIELDNDANVAALGERWKGAGEGGANVVFVTLGTGVGGGIFAEGKILHGIRGAAGEIGHVTVVPENGYDCTCGKKGCLETVASATGIVRVAKDLAKEFTGESALKEAIDKQETITSKLIFELGAENDKLANETIDKISFYLALALSHIGNMLNPEKIIIGGGVSAAGDQLLTPVRNYFETMVFPAVKESTKLSIATKGNDAGIIGAAWLALPAED